MSNATARRHSLASERVLYKTARVKGLDIFYREAGSPANPITVVTWLPDLVTDVPQSDSATR